MVNYTSQLAQLVMLATAKRIAERYPTDPAGARSEALAHECVMDETEKLEFEVAIQDFYRQQN